MRKTAPTLRAHEVEDLVQAAYEHALRLLARFEGRSTLKTWFVSLARNLFIDLSRRAAIRPVPAGELALERAAHARPEVEELRNRTLELHAWLNTDEGKRVVPRGAETLTFLVNTGGDFDRTAQTMQRFTGRRWPIERVRRTVDVIKRTTKGRALAQAIGVDVEDEGGSEEDRDHG